MTSNSCKHCEDNNELKERIDKLELDLNKIFHVHDNKIDNLEDGIEKCFEKIEKLENLFPDVLQDFKKRIIDLEESYQVLSEELNYILDKKVNKKPHKCPVCDGKILTELKITRTESGMDKLIIECHACEGKGIVWG